MLGSFIFIFLVLVLFITIFNGTSSSVIINSQVRYFEDSSILNERPIIGILAEEQHNRGFENYSSSIVASYVKSIESSGARVVPVMIGKDKHYYKQLMNNLNGILFPGGDLNFDDKNGYGDAGEMIYEIAKEFNDKGDYFPLWGTCLGFELLTYLSARRKNILSDCVSENLADPLYFVKDYRSSNLFRYADQFIVDTLRSLPITINFHKYCLTKENMTKFGIEDEWRIITTNFDEKGLSYVSTLESNKYPFYGVQFHPEKVSFEWYKQQKTPHSYQAIIANRYFIDFFVSESRKSRHRFENETEEEKALIYNFQPFYTGLKISPGYAQSYFFN